MLVTCTKSPGTAGFAAGAVLPAQWGGQSPAGIPLNGLVNTKGLGKFAPVLIGLLSGLAEVERSLIQERTLESIQHRRATGGNLGGRPKTNEAKERLVLRLRDEGCSYRSIREQTGLALSTIRRIIAEQEATA